MSKASKVSSEEAAEAVQEVSPEESTAMVASDCGAQKNCYEQFETFFSGRPKDQKICVVMQHTPDPDAVGSALGLEYLLEELYGLQTDIYYAGKISHPQNQTEVNVLDVRLKHKDDFIAEGYSTFLTVDTVPQNTGFNDLIPEWHGVIDHHQFDVDLDFVDIRACGSASAILWDYLIHYELDMKSEKGSLVATALLFGVVNDTHHLLTENVSSLDLKAHAALINHIDRKKYQEILRYPLPPYLFRLRVLAAENMVNEASILISYLGILTEKRRDALPIIADEFLRMEGVETVVVFAMIEGTIDASVRSHNSSVNVHQFCQKVFGADNGGGKQGAGGAKVDLGFLHSPDDDTELKEKLSEFAKDTITKRIIRHLSGA